MQDNGIHIHFIRFLWCVCMFFVFVVVGDVVDQVSGCLLACINLIHTYTHALPHIWQSQLGTLSKSSRIYACRRQIQFHRFNNWFLLAHCFPIYSILH